MDNKIVNSIWLVDRDGNITQALNLYTAVHTEELNGQNVLEFTTYDTVDKGERVIYQDVTGKWHEFIVQEIVEDRNMLTAYCEHSAYELHGAFVMDKRPESHPRGHLDAILEGTRWTSEVKGSHAAKLVTYYRISAYNALNKMAEEFEAYRTYEIQVEGTKVTGRKIVLWDKLGNDLGKRFEYTKDLENVTRTVGVGDVITALYGFGKGEEIGDGYGRRLDFKSLNKVDSPIGKAYVTNELARAKWGIPTENGKIHFFGSEVFDDIEDPEELYLAAKKKLEEVSTPDVNYETVVILLSDDHEQVGLGDRVAIIDRGFRDQELRLRGEIIKLERDLLNTEQSKVQIGKKLITSADADNELIDFINNFRDRSGVWDKSNNFDKDGNLPGSKIKELLEGWNMALNSAGGFVYAEPGEGIITYDKAVDDDPTMAIQITGAGWRIANSKLPNGEWDWRTAATGDGIAGDAIVAYSITANQLSSDVGSSLDLSSNNSINLIVGDINRIYDEMGAVKTDYNRIPNLNGDFENYMFWSWKGTELLTFETMPKFVPNLQYGTNFEIKNYPQSVSTFGLSFFANGEAITGLARLVKDEEHSFRTRRIGSIKPFTVIVMEYDVDEELIKSTPFLLDSEEYEKFTFMPDTNSRYARLSFKITNASLTDRLEITETMFNYGAPLNWQETPSDLKQWTLAQLSIRDDEIKSTVEEVRLVHGKTVENKSSITQNASQIKSSITAITRIGRVAEKASTDITVLAGEVDLKVSKDGIIGGINATPETVKINSSLLDFDNAKGSNVDLTGRFRVNHSDGSFTEMNSSGIRRHTSDEVRDYHYLVYAENFIYGSANVSSVRWIQLPNDFKGKQFKVFFSIADTLQVVSYWRALQRMVCIGHPNYNIDYTNARVPVMAYKSETITDSGNAPDITSVQGVVWAIY